MCLRHVLQEPNKSRYCLHFVQSNVLEQLRDTTSNLEIITVIDTIYAVQIFRVLVSQVVPDSDEHLYGCLLVHSIKQIIWHLYDACHDQDVKAAQLITWIQERMTGVCAPGVIGPQPLIFDDECIVQDAGLYYNSLHIGQLALSAASALERPQSVSNHMKRLLASIENRSHIVALDVILSIRYSFQTLSFSPGVLAARDQLLAELARPTQADTHKRRLYRANLRAINDKMHLPLHAQTADHLGPLLWVTQAVCSGAVDNAGKLTELANRSDQEDGLGGPSISDLIDQSRPHTENGPPAPEQPPHQGDQFDEGGPANPQDNGPPVHSGATAGALQYDEQSGATQPPPMSPPMPNYMDISPRSLSPPATARNLRLREFRPPADFSNHSSSYNPHPIPPRNGRAPTRKPVEECTASSSLPKRPRISTRAAEETAEVQHIPSGYGMDVFTGKLFNHNCPAYRQPTSSTSHAPRSYGFNNPSGASDPRTADRLDYQSITEEPAEIQVIAAHTDHPYHEGVGGPSPGDVFSDEPPEVFNVGPPLDLE